MLPAAKRQCFATETGSSEYLDSARTLARGYSAGAVITMRLHDFQVARDASYLFEPYLNVILGSNGSGKSTVITALFVLFRGSVSDLQHKSYSEFVRHGCAKARVSVIIQGKTINGPQNPVVMLEISAKPATARDRGVQWYIDGNAVSTASLDAFIAEYSIEVGNLCQFLPQFRVSAFCMESKEQRLVSTERAVGYAGMQEDHQFLAAIDKEIGDVALDLEEVSALVTRLQARKQELEARIERVEKAVAEKQNIAFLENVLCLLDWKRLQTTLEELETALRAARHELENFAATNAATSHRIDECANRVSELHGELKLEKLETKTSQETSVRTLNKSRVLLEKVDKLSAGLKTQLDELKQARNSLVQLKQDKAREEVERRELAEKLEQIKSPDFEALVARREQLKTQERAVQPQLDAGRAKLEDLKISQSKARANVDMQKRLRDKLEKSGGSHRDVEKVRDVLHFDRGAIARAVKFVRAHADKFEKPVIEPAVLTISVTDQRVLPMFAAASKVTNLQKFVCQTEADQRTLAQLASSSNVAYSAVFLEHVKPRENVDVSEFGFAGTLYDVLSGPEPMLAYMRQLRLDKIPYALQPLNDRQRERVRTSRKFAEYVDREQYTRVRTSRYGQQRSTELSERVKPAPEWAQFMLKKDVSAHLARAEKAFTDAKNRLNLVQTSIAEQEQELQTLVDARAAFVSQRSELMKSMREQENLQKRIERLDVKLANLASQIEAREKRAEDSQTAVMKTRAELVSAVKQLNTRLGDARSVESAVLHQKQAKLKQMCIFDLQEEMKVLGSKYKLLQTGLEERVAVLATEKKQFVEEHKQDYKQHKLAEKWMQQNQLTDKAAETMLQMDAAGVRAEISRLSDGLALADQESSNFESLKLQLDNTATQLTENRNKLLLDEQRKTQLIDKAAQIREKWESALKTIIETASLEFARMFHELGCKGHVALTKDDTNVGTWGIDIFVAFRKNEEPSKLSKARQSGGERAVSTAVYLLALQQLNKAPFRVLDEINQGMDEQNERKTMSFFVEHACSSVKGRAQQYFLVSPKLIPNLPTHRRMNIVFITGSTAIGDTARLIPPTKPEDRKRWLAEEEG